MDTKFIMITLGVWFLFVIFAIINGGIRNKFFKPYVGDSIAHQISTIIFIIVILIVTYLILKFSYIQLSDSQAIIMGTIWLLLTIFFEFIAGHYIFGNPWDKLVSDYNILKGRIWSLVLLTTFLAPYITNKFL
jgi:hypothetical protein